MARIHKEEWKIHNNVFDKFTLDTLDKLSGQGHYDELMSPVMIGKEANVFTATKGEETVIIKIYRLENSNFNKMLEYLNQDPRFFGISKKKRNVVFSWVQREYRNLMLAREHCRVPTPYAYKNNVLIMELIGDGKPALQLKDTIPGDDFLEKLVVEIRNLWHNAKLVHADLSSFNILNWNDNPVMIDFSQSSPKDSHHAMEYLERDIKNVAKFFKVDEKELLNRIIENN